MLVDPSGYIAVVDDAVWAILIYEAAKVAFGATVGLVAIIGAAAAGQAIGKKYYSSNPGTDGSSALQRPKDPFKPELKLYKGNKKNLRPFISPVPETDKTKMQAVFTVNPYDFNPKGLIRNVYVQPGAGKNGGIIKWEIPETRVAIFEWNEDYQYGSHYHVMKIGQNNQHYGLHYYPGDFVPEPWNTTYF